MNEEEKANREYRLYEFLRRASLDDSILLRTERGAGNPCPLARLRTKALRIWREPLRHREAHLLDGTHEHPSPRHGHHTEAHQTSHQPGTLTPVQKTAWHTRHRTDARCLHPGVINKYQKK